MRAAPKAKASQAAQPGARLAVADGLHAELERFQMDDVEQCDIGDGRRQKACLMIST